MQEMNLASSLQEDYSFIPSLPPEHVETVPTGQARRFTTVLAQSCFESSVPEKSPPTALPAGELCCM